MDGSRFALISFDSTPVFVKCKSSLFLLPLLPSSLADVGSAATILSIGAQFARSRLLIVSKYYQLKEMLLLTAMLSAAYHLQS